MSTTMRAARYYGNRDVRVEDLPIPQAGPGESLVEVEWCGICGSDMHEYVAGPMATPTKARPHALTGGYIPVTLGHEFCGRIKTTSPGSKFHVGQAVMVDPHLACRECFACQAGLDNLCQKLGFIGCSGGARCGGGLSEYVVVEDRHLHVLPDNVGLEHAAVIEPLVVGHHAVKVAGASLAGLDVLIVGGGPVGAAMICVLRAHKVRRILLSEPTAKRWEHAKTVVDRVIDPKTESVGDVCRNLTGGRGVDVVFDCAGVQRGLEAGLDALRRGGTFVNVAMWESSLQVPFFPFFLKEVKILSSCCYDEKDFEETMALIGRGQFEGYEAMVTSRIGLEDVVSKGFEELATNKDDHIKILISPKPKA